MFRYSFSLSGYSTNSNENVAKLVISYEIISPERKLVHGNS